MGRPDIVIARCKTLLRKDMFSTPSRGTIVFHPGICPEHRNAHGCFWALANNDVKKVGLTLLRIDEGVDTGRVYAYCSCDFDEVAESHILIQHRVLLDNLDGVQEKLQDIAGGAAVPLDTSGRSSGSWGFHWFDGIPRRP